MNKTARLAFVFTVLAWTGMLVADALPEGYKEVQWIESSGQQWIDTELRPNCSDTVEVKFMAPVLRTSNEFLYCARGVENAATFTCVKLDSQSLRIDRKDGSVGQSGMIYAYTVYTLTVNGHDQTSYLNDVEIKCTKKSGDFEVGGDFLLFGGYSGDKSVVSNLSTLRLYSFKVIAADGAVRADLVPCVREADSAVGLYDRARKAFYGNSGSGSFDFDTYGQRHRLPADYQKCQWIESSGKQWIDTQVRPRCLDTVEVKFMAPVLPSTSGFLYCARGASNHNTFTCLKQASNVLRFDYGEGTVLSALNALVKDKDYVLTVNGRTQVYLLNDEKHTLWTTFEPFVVGGDLVLFGGYSGDKTAVSYFGSFRLYSFRVITDDGGTRAELVPCIRKADQKPGLYDLVNERFLVNGGQGEFAYSVEPVKGLMILFK